MSDDDENPEVWQRRAVERMLATWKRLAPAYRRHLARQALAADPLDDLLTLAARRELPLQPPRTRLLPREALSPLATAQLRLVRPDRIALRDVLAGAAVAPNRREHAAAALQRLVHNARAARRWSDAPLAGRATDVGVGGCD